MFDDALVESRKSSALGGRRRSLPLAIGLHAAVIGAFVGASAWRTEEPVEPVTMIRCFPLTKLPPPTGVRGRTELPRDSRPHSTRALVQPDTSRLESATATSDADSHEELGSEPSSANGDAAGMPDGADGADGVDGGTGIDVAEGVPGPSEGEVLPVGGDVRAPVLVERVEPDFPESARRAHLDGMVILEAVITTAGDVREIRVLRSANPLLDEAAVRAVRRWRYRPATLNGRAVPVYLTVTVTFGIAG
jgi:protein TonB